MEIIFNDVRTYVALYALSVVVLLVIQVGVLRLEAEAAAAIGELRESIAWLFSSSAAAPRARCNAGRLEPYDD